MNLGTKRVRSKAVDVSKLVELWRKLVAEGKTLKDITSEVNKLLGSNFTEGSLGTKIETVRQKMAEQFCERHKRTIESWKNAGPLGLKNWETFQEQITKKINESIPKPQRANRTKAVVEQLVADMDIDMDDFGLDGTDDAASLAENAVNGNIE